MDIFPSRNLWYCLKENMNLTPTSPLLKASIPGVIRLFLSNLSGLAWSEMGSSREKTDVLVTLKGDYK